MKCKHELKLPPKLHLNLDFKWYQLIETGVKMEDYRAIKPFYNRIFVNGKIKVKGKYYHPTDVVICFSNGYAPNRKQMQFWCSGLRIGVGKSEWGARENEEYIIKIGARYES